MKTLKNVELLHNFEENVNNKNINSIIKNEESLKKEDKYIEKLSDKLSKKFQILIIILHKIRKNMFFLNTHDYYNENPKDILNHIKKIYIKSNIGYNNIYKPRAKTVNVSLDTIIRRIENDDKISQELKDNYIDGYDNIPDKTKIQFHNKYYREYVMEPVEKYHKEKNIEADDEKSIIKDDYLLIDIIPETIDKEDKSLED